MCLSVSDVTVSIVVNAMVVGNHYTSQKSSNGNGKIYGRARLFYFHNRDLNHPT